jgi:hypothetical protein
MQAAQKIASHEGGSESLSPTLKSAAEEDESRTRAIAFHDACRRAADLVATERNKSMSPAPKRDTLMPVIEAPGSKARDLPSFAGNVRWLLDGGHTAPRSRPAETLTRREREVIAMISQGFSNKRIKAAIHQYILRSWSIVKKGTTANHKKLLFNLRKAKSKISALEDGDLPPEQVKLIAQRLGVTEQEVVDMNPPPQLRRIVQFRRVAGLVDRRNFNSRDTTRRERRD